MTLRNKISQIIYSTINYYNYNLTKEVEDVADKHAISFSKWVEDLRRSEEDTNDYDLYLRKTQKELLKIYKKEKGL